MLCPNFAELSENPVSNSKPFSTQLNTPLLLSLSFCYVSNFLLWHWLLKKKKKRKKKKQPPWSGQVSQWLFSIPQSFLDFWELIQVQETVVSIWQWCWEAVKLINLYAAFSVYHCADGYVCFLIKSGKFAGYILWATTFALMSVCREHVALTRNACVCLHN